MMAKTARLVHISTLYTMMIKFSVQDAYMYLPLVPQVRVLICDRVITSFSRNNRVFKIKTLIWYEPLLISTCTLTVL